MAILREYGEPNVEHYQKVASSAIDNGEALNFNSSGYLQPGSNTMTEVVGFSLRQVESSDDDYADNSNIPIDVPRTTDEFRATVTTGSASQSDVGTAYDLDSDATGVNLNSTTNAQFMVTRVIDSSTVVGRVAKRFAE